MPAPVAAAMLVSVAGSPPLQMVWLAPMEPDVTLFTFIDPLKELLLHVPVGVIV